MAGSSSPRERRLSARMREEERVTPLELFFDLVFVLALTQCTALMSEQPTWEGLAQGTLILGMLWQSWVGYAWLTSVVDPEEGAVRLVIFAAMAALLVISLCIPEAFGDLGLLFAVGYGVVRLAHIALFMLASREDPNLRRSVLGLAASTAIAVALLVGASFLDGDAQLGAWALALALDAGGPFLFGAEGWKLMPGHFAKRHGLIVLVALGMKKTLGHVDEPLAVVPAFALLGGLAVYLLGHVGFRYRHIHTINVQRLALALALLAAVPIATALEPPAIATLGAITAVLVALIVYETIGYGNSRSRLRHELGSVSGAGS